MAGFKLPIDSSDPDFRRIRLIMSPRSVSQLIDSVLSLLWLTLPVEERNIMTLEHRVRVAFAEVAEAWRTTHLAERPAACAAMWPHDVETTDVASAQPDPNESDATGGMPDLSKFFGPEQLRQQLWQALDTAQLILPTNQQSDTEVETIVRQILDRSLSLWWEDARRFNMGVR